MKKILIAIILSSLPLSAGDSAPVKGFPYLRTQIVGMSKGEKTVRIMVWAKDVPLTLRAFRVPNDRDPLVQKVAKGATADIKFRATNNYIIQVEWEGKVISKITPRNKGGGL